MATEIFAVLSIQAIVYLSKGKLALNKSFLSCEHDHRFDRQFVLLGRG